MNFNYLVAPSSALFTASKTPFEEFVAPLTASTPSVPCFSIISGIILSLTPSISVFVSLCSTTSTVEILPFSTLTSTLIVPEVP